nr:ABC transporter permease [Rhodococcus sp. 15-1154-1]
MLLQYLSYLKRVFTGDLGRSYQLQRPVADVIGAELWPTVSLAVPAVVLAVVIACVLALTTAGRPRSRSWASSFELLSVSIPTFWIGILLLWVFAFTLGWFPASSAKTDASLVLPVVTLALPVAGLLSQVLRDGVEDALAQPFVLTAQARGASRARVLLVHAFRHALLPATTLTAYFVGATLGGAVLTETVFARPGLGRVTLAAIGSKDMPVVLGIVLLSALVFIVVNTVLDALYVVIDPRLRTTSRRRPGTAKEVPA